MGSLLYHFYSCLLFQYRSAFKGKIFCSLGGKFFILLVDLFQKGFIARKVIESNKSCFPLQKLKFSKGHNLVNSVDGVMVLVPGMG